MRRPFRRYCFYLGEKLGMTLVEVEAMSGQEISEWMAYDRTNDDEWMQEYNKQVELERQRKVEESTHKTKLFDKLFRC